MAKQKFPDYKYKGHSYKPWVDEECDDRGVVENTKIFHTVEHTDGILKEIDWCPYRVPSFDEFKLWIDLGYPNRYDHAFGKRTAWFPIDSKGLQIIHNFRFSTPDGRGF